MGATAAHDGKISRWWLAIPIGMMGVFMALIVFTAGMATMAGETAHEADQKAQKVANDLSVHAARQNGSFESIKSQLSTIKVEMQGQRQVLNELLRHSYSEHSPSTHTPP
jgi:hypothetical protein